MNGFDLDKLHTTPLGEVRIRRNLGLSEDTDPVEYCRGVIAESNICRRGKNFYCEGRGIVITVNARSITIITAHRIK